MIPKLHNLSKPADLADNRYLGGRLSQPVLADLMSPGEFGLARKRNNVYGVLDRNVGVDLERSRSETKSRSRKVRARREKGRKTLKG